MVPSHRRVVVGYDDSRCSREALAWAVQEAQRRQFDLHVVHVVHGRPRAAGVPAVEIRL